MTTKDSSKAPPSGQQGLDEDVLCPECNYNLRGLTVPRCPECGLRFDWSEIPKFKEPKPYSTPKWFPFAFATVLFLGLCIAEPGFLMLLVLVLPILVASVQAVFECALVMPLLGTLSWRHFRAWWEGVIVGYAVCYLTWYASGWYFSCLDELQPWAVLLRLWPVMVITTIEAFVVQWLVVRARARRWELAIPAKRLVQSCALAKLVSVIPWLFFARMLGEF